MGDKKTETSMSSNVESDASNTPGFQPKLGAWGTDTKLAAAAGGIEVSDTESDVSGMSPRSPRFDISDESEADATPRYGASCQVLLFQCPKFFKNGDSDFI